MFTDWRFLFFLSFLFNNTLHENEERKKKLEAELTASVLKKDQKHKMLHRTLFNQTKQDRKQISEGIPIFKATNNTDTNKSLSYSQLSASGTVGCFPLAAAKWFVCFCIICGFEEEDSLENVHGVSLCVIKKRSTLH